MMDEEKERILKHIQRPIQTVTDDSVLTLMGRWAWGYCATVDTKDHYAFIGNGPTFHVLDIADPSSPVIVGEYITDGRVSHIRIKDSCAFVAMGYGLLILDISDPAFPTKISDIDISGAYRVAPVDSFVFVSTVGGSVRLVDITNINQPILRGSAPAGGEIPRCLEAKGRYGYVGNWEVPYLELIDATNPDTLTSRVIAYYNLTWGLHIEDTLMYVAMWEDSAEMRVWSVADPASPFEVGGIVLGGTYGAEAWAVVSQGHMAFVTGASSPSTSSGVYAIDVSNPTQPILRDHYLSENYFTPGSGDITLINGLACVAEGSGLWVVNVADSTHLQDAGFFPTGSYAYKAVLRGDLLFTTNWYAGLWILDISDPAYVGNIANLQNGTPAEELLVDSNCVYIVMGNKLVICDITDVYHPTIVATYGDGIEYIDKAGDLIYAAHDKYENTLDSAFEVIDVSNVATPFPVGWYSSLYKPKDILIKDSICYMATQDAGLRIIDVHDPVNPSEINHFLIPIFGLAAQDSLLFASSAYLYSINIDNPHNAFILDTLQVGSGVSEVDMAMGGHHLYWVGNGLTVVDISNPYQLQVIASAEGGYGIAAKHDTVVTTDFGDGVLLYRNNRMTAVSEGKVLHPRKSLLAQNYPNPFNNSTTIRFDVPNESFVSLELYNILGQKIQTVLNRSLSTGHHAVDLELSGLASGVYLYRLTVNGFSITKKLCLIK